MSDADRVEELENENEKLRERVDELEERVEELEEKLGDNYVGPVVENILDRINSIKTEIEMEDD